MRLTRYHSRLYHPARSRQRQHHPRLGDSHLDFGMLSDTRGRVRRGNCDVAHLEAVPGLVIRSFLRWHMSNCQRHTLYALSCGIYHLLHYGAI